MHRDTGPGADDAVQLVRQAIVEWVRPGTVVDLGATDASFGEAIVAAGYAYVGMTDRLDVLGLLRKAGLQAVRIAPDDVTRLLDALVGVENIAAFVLRDHLDRAVDPERLLSFLATQAIAHQQAKLIVSVPNVGHQQIALRLLAGDLPPELEHRDGVGRRRAFTGRSLAELVAATGWQVAARHDLHGDGGSADDRSLLLAPTMVGDFLRSASTTFNPDARTIRFVWTLTPTAAPAQAPDAPATAAPLLSILIRTQGERNDVLTEALYSIYSQTCDDYEVVVCFHRPGEPSGEVREATVETISRLPASLRDRLRLVDASEPGRGTPLNVLLEHARGTYVSILDDDDLLFEHHVETIARGVAEHGALVLFQTYAAQRLINPVAHSDVPGIEVGVPSRRRRQYPYTAIDMTVPWAEPVDIVRQHHENMVPICCLALPLQLVRQTNLRFRTDLEVGEEWAFWMDAFQLLRVVVLPEVTAAINHWNNTVTNAMRRPETAIYWRQVRDSRHREIAHVPLLLDGAIRLRLAASGQQVEELAWTRDEVARREQRLQGIYRSRIWRIARAFWRARDTAQRLRAKLDGLLGRERPPGKRPG